MDWQTQIEYHQKLKSTQVNLTTRHELGDAPANADIQNPCARDSDWMPSPGPPGPPAIINSNEKKLWRDPPFMDGNDRRKREEATTVTEFSLRQTVTSSWQRLSFSPHDIWLNVPSRSSSEHGKLEKD